MKNLKNLNGFKTLTKEEQLNIDGGRRRYVYCKGSNQCCMRFDNGYEFCDYGYCQGPGRCIWA